MWPLITMWGCWEHHTFLYGYRTWWITIANASWLGWQLLLPKLEHNGSVSDPYCAIWRQVLLFIFSQKHLPLCSHIFNEFFGSCVRFPAHPGTKNCLLAYFLVKCLSWCYGFRVLYFYVSRFLLHICVDLQSSSNVLLIKMWTFKIISAFVNCHLLTFNCSTDILDKNWHCHLGNLLNYVGFSGPSCLACFLQSSWSGLWQSRHGHQWLSILWHKEWASLLYLLCKRCDVPQPLIHRAEQRFKIHYTLVLPRKIVEHSWRI